MEIQDRQDCQLDIMRIEELLNTGIFNSPNAGHPLQPSAFIELMICLRDLLHKCEKYSKRIAFTDDVIQGPYVNDVTDAITAVRDACCHINSFKKLFDDRGNRGSYLVGYGRCNLMQIDDLQLKSDYDDEMAIFYGKNRLYMRRHIVRAFNEAKQALASLL